MEKEKPDGICKVDVLYIIGNGSINNNAELLYSLRMLSKNASNIGRVVVCRYEYHGASCYAVSADGIDRLVRLYKRCLGYGKWKDRTLMVCDQWFSEKYMKPSRKCYFAYPPAGIQRKTSDTVTKAGFDMDARYQSFGIDTRLYREDF